MKFIYNEFLIKGNELTYYIFITSIIIMILITGILVYKEVKNKK